MAKNEDLTKMARTSQKSWIERRRPSQVKTQYRAFPHSLPPIPPTQPPLPPPPLHLTLPSNPFLPLPVDQWERQ